MLDSRKIDRHFHMLASPCPSAAKRNDGGEGGPSSVQWYHIPGSSCMMNDYSELTLVNINWIVPLLSHRTPPNADIFEPTTLPLLCLRTPKASRVSIKIDEVKGFTFGQMALATNSFNNSTQVGRGGYGKVDKGTLADGTAVAVKRVLEGSLQGEKELLTEIELLSRVHHRNLVSLVGYCDEEGEQEFKIIRAAVDVSGFFFNKDEVIKLNIRCLW